MAVQDKMIAEVILRSALPAVRAELKRQAADSLGYFGEQALGEDSVVYDGEIDLRSLVLAMADSILEVAPNEQ